MSAKKKVTEKRLKKREKKGIAVGRAYIQSTFNNTIITITDLQGNTITWGSCGTVGFTGTKKGTAYAAQRAAAAVAKRAMEHGVREIEVFVRGPGPGREAAIRTLRSSGLRIKLIRDVTPIPHDGCRPPKKRRV